SPKPSDMYRRPMHRVSRLADGLRKRGVGVNGTDELLRRALSPQRQRGFGHELSGAGTDHVEPQQLIVTLLRHDFDKPFGLAGHLRAAQHTERKRSDPDVVAALLRLPFGKPYAPNLRVAVRARRHMIVVDWLHRLARNPLRGNDAFRRRDMRELRMWNGSAERNHIADG